VLTTVFPAGEGRIFERGLAPPLADALPWIRLFGEGDKIERGLATPLAQALSLKMGIIKTEHSSFILPSSFGEGDCHAPISSGLAMTEK